MQLTSITIHSVFLSFSTLAPKTITLKPQVKKPWILQQDPAFLVVWLKIFWKKTLFSLLQPRKSRKNLRESLFSRQEKSYFIVNFHNAEAPKCIIFWGASTEKSTTKTTHTWHIPKFTFWKEDTLPFQSPIL